MANNKSEHLLDEIGQLLASDREYPLNDTLLYAKLVEGSSSPAVFKNRGNHVLYRRPDLEAWGDLLTDLWDEADPNKRWAEMEYLIRDGRFSIIYVYPDEIDPDEDPFDRRDRVVAKYFGDKPIVYPPWAETGAQTFTL